VTLTELSQIDVNPVTDKLSTICNFSNLNLIEGNRYKVVLKARNTTMEWSDIYESNVFEIDITPPVLAFSTDNILYNKLDTVNDSFNVSEKGTIQFIISDPNGTTVSNSILTCNEGINNFSFLLDQSGEYWVTAIPIDIAGNKGVQVQKKYKVNFSAVFTTEPYAINIFNEKNIGTMGQTLNFFAESNDPDGTVSSYSWDFNDGTPSVNGKDASHVYENIGVYSVKVTVKDNNGAVSTANVTVNITNTMRGQLYRNENWTGTNNIIDDILVPVGIKLTISQDAVINLANNIKIIVDGALNTNGTNILFQSGSYWSGIIFENNSSGVINGITVKNALRGISIVDNANVFLSDSIFDSNDIGVHVYGTIPNINGSTFTNNAIYGIKEDGGGIPVVKNCVFNNNGIDYYDEVNTEITIDELNDKPQNSGNRK
jgi:hypothetical protein